MRVACYARVSKIDQKTLTSQIKAMKAYAKRRNWRVVSEVKEIGSDVKNQKNRQSLLEASLRQEIDVIIVWKLDRWARSIADLISSLRDLTEVGVGFVSITEALDLTTPSSRALSEIFNVFANFEQEILSVRIKKGIAESRRKGRSHGRPVTIGNKAEQIKKLFKRGHSKSEIARRLNISRTSVRRLLNQ